MCVGFRSTSQHREADEVAARMKAFSRRINLETMFVRSVAVGTGMLGAARHDCFVKEERPNVELQLCKATAWTTTARSETLWQKNPADQARTEASGLSARCPLTEAYIEVTLSAYHFEVAAGVEREGTLEMGPVKDLANRRSDMLPMVLAKALTEWMLQISAQRMYSSLFQRDSTFSLK